MPRRDRDTLDKLFSSVEVFVCGGLYQSRKATSAQPASPTVRVVEKDDKIALAKAKVAEPDLIEDTDPTPALVDELVIEEAEQEPDIKPEPATEPKPYPGRVVVEPEEEPEPTPAVVPAPPELQIPEPLAIEKDPATISIRKSNANERTNLELVSYYEKPGVFVKTIKVGSKFLGTNLQVGMKISRINGESCPPGVKETIDMMRATPDILTLTAVVVEVEDDDFMFKEIRSDEFSEKEEEIKEEPGSPPRFATAAWFACFYPGNVAEAADRSMADESRFSRLSRKEGMKNNVARTERDRIGLGLADRVLKQLGVIENDEVDDDSVVLASTFDEMSTTFKSNPTLEDDDNTFTTVGGSTLADSSSIFAKILKKKRRDNVGIHFVSFKKRQGVYVYRIHKDSKFQETDLEPGMKVLSVNGDACPDSVGDTLALVKSVKGELVIEAIYPSNETEDKFDATSQQRGSTGSSGKVRDQPSPGSAEVKMAVKVPSTIGMSEEKEGEQEDQEEKKEVVEEEEVQEEEKGDAADDDESCIYESLPPPKHAIAEEPKGASWKALAACGVGNE